MLTDKQKDAIEYVTTFLAALFLALDKQFGFVVSESWIEVASTGLALLVVGYGIYHNKHLFIDKPDKKD